MDSKLCLCPPKTYQHTSLPLLLSHKNAIFKNPISHKPKLVSLSTQRSCFLGKGLIFGQNTYGFCKNKKTHVPICPITISAAVKRRKEVPFDSVIQRDKKLKLVLKIRKILMSQPDKTMPLREMGKFRRQLGLQRGKRFIALLKKFPAVFEIEEEGAYMLRFKLTTEAERLYFEELKIRNEMEEVLIVKLRKLLMMSLEKRVLLDKIAHLRTDLGLPLEFRDTICHRYPQYFKVVATDRGPALELTHWDPELAVSAAEMAEEENRVRELEEKNLIIDRPLKFNRVPLPKGLKLSRGEMRRISQFRDMPYISPYSDFSDLRSGSAEKEKHACGVIHELLSLTVEKKTLVDHLTHFREEFRFSQQLRGMLIRHPDLFYVSLKGDRDSVFLREAYRGSQLVDKDKILVVKEKMRALVNVPRFRRRGIQKGDYGEEGTDEQQDGTSDGEDEWSDFDNAIDDDADESDEDYEDVWTDDDDDDDDDTPPDFDDDDDDDDDDGDGDGVKVKMDEPKKKFNPLPVKEEPLLVFPDGRPRDRW